jgi:hypothetical protein
MLIQDAKNLILEIKVNIDTLTNERDFILEKLKPENDRLTNIRDEIYNYTELLRSLENFAGRGDCG